MQHKLSFSQACRDAGFLKVFRHVLRVGVGAEKAHHPARDNAAQVAQHAAELIELHTGGTPSVARLNRHN